MLKKMITICTIISMILSILPATNIVASNDDINGSVTFFDCADNKEITVLKNQQSIYAEVKFTAPKDGEVTIVTAQYSSAGILKNVSEVSVDELTPGSQTTYTTEKTDVSDAGEIRIFVWDGYDNLVPVLKNPGQIERTLNIEGSASAEVSAENGATAEDIIVSTEKVSAFVPTGTQLADGATVLSLSVSEIKNSQSNISVKENEIILPIDIHMEGISENNRIPVIVTVTDVLAPGLNKGNLSLYHVEKGQTVKMTEVSKEDELTGHNQFYYDALTGTIVIAMATFSEVVAVTDTNNAWNGTVATEFAGGSGKETDPYLIANADQLAYMGDRVSNDNANYGSAHYRLTADINIGGSENYNINGRKVLFYPIGYNKVGGTTTDKGDWYTYGGSFKGTFDGAGHTISGIYQNTWAMVGDYSGTYYNDAMGLFGYVNGGTVKNITIDNFYSEGEFAPTGCVTAYAAGNATFENIAITNSHPQTYNTGVAGIAGWDNGGDTESEASNFTFKNITIDDSNIISALWGSWDVAAAGLLGYLGEYSSANLKNCNVAATIDVYNDVCGNYQYYWYRYCGMMIGTVDKTDDKGKLDLSNITAKNCTANFGERHEYYYCEFVKNSIASYTHDYQFSRVDNDDIEVIGENATCKNHNHEERGTEIINGKEVLIEDKQAVYIPFRQLFGGYGWGVDGVYVTEWNEKYPDSDIEIEVVGTSQEKFETKFTNDYLYRVGSAENSPVALGTLFAAVEGTTINDSGVYVTIDKVDENTNVSGTFTPNRTEWEKGTIQFSGTGVVKVTIQDYDYCTPTELYLEVVDAKNITSATGAKDTDVVILNNLQIATGGVVYYENCTVYGNGFEFNVTGGVNTQTNGTNYHGIINLTNATLDNLVVLGEVYDKYGAYYQQDDYTAAINATGSIIQNCHISNCSAPIRSKGDNKVENTTLYGGTIANMIIEAGTNTLNNVTTVNYNDGRAVVGFGILISKEASETAKLILNGDFKQHNFISKNDSSLIADTNAQTLFNEMFNDTYSDYHFGSNPIYVNPGVLSMAETFDVDDITDKTGNGYEGQQVSYTVPGLGSYKGYLHSLKADGNSVDNNYNAENDSHKAGKQGDYLPEFDLVLGEQAINGEDRYLRGDKNAVEARYVEGEAAINLDITKLAKICKYDGTQYDVTASCIDASGNAVAAINGVITLNETKNYALLFDVEDNLFYDKNGKRMEKSVNRTYRVPLSVTVAEPAVKDTVITIKNNAQSGSYSGLTDKTITFNPLNAITVTDAEGTVDLTTNIASTNIVYASSSSAFAGTTTITVTYNDGRILTILLGKPTLNSPGSSKAITYANDGTIKSAGAVASKSATGGTWTVTSYSFKGTNGKTVTNNTVVTFTFPDKSCVTGDTLVTLADGSRKRIDEITYEDQLLVWDFFNGKYAQMPSSIIFYHGDDNYRILNLKFEDGSNVKVINNHGFFDADKNKFVFIDENNVKDYIGHNFVKENANSYKEVQLTGYSVTNEYTGCYSIQSAQHNNFITNGMFSITIPEYEGWFDYFEIGNNMKYDEKKMQVDIEKYGLYTYSDFADYVTYEQFVAFSGPYLKVLVGRGVVTYEQIITLIKNYVNT